MQRRVIPYSFEDETLPQSLGRPLPGKYQCVQFTVAGEISGEMLLNKIRQWFAGRREIILVDDGSTSKRGHAFIVMEWEECTIDPLFLSILEHEDAVDDYCVYIRDMEDYQ